MDDSSKPVEQTFIGKTVRRLQVTSLGVASRWLGELCQSHITVYEKTPMPQRMSCSSSNTQVCLICDSTYSLNNAKETLRKIPVADNIDDEHVAYLRNIALAFQSTIEKCQKHFQNVAPKYRREIILMTWNKLNERLLFQSCVGHEFHRHLTSWIVSCASLVNIANVVAPNVTFDLVMNNTLISVGRIERLTENDFLSILAGVRNNFAPNAFQEIVLSASPYGLTSQVNNTITTLIAPFLGQRLVKLDMGTICNDRVLPLIADLQLKELAVGGMAITESGLLNYLCGIKANSASKVTDKLIDGEPVYISRPKICSSLVNLKYSLLHLPEEMILLLPAVFPNLLEFDVNRNIIQILRRYDKLLSLSSRSYPLRSANATSIFKEVKKPKTVNESAATDHGSEPKEFVESVYFELKDCSKNCVAFDSKLPRKRTLQEGFDSSDDEKENDVARKTLKMSKTSNRQETLTLSNQLNWLKINGVFSNPSEFALVNRLCPNIENFSVNIFTPDFREVINMKKLKILSLTQFSQYADHYVKHDSSCIDILLENFQNQLTSLSLNGFSLTANTLFRISRLPYLNSLCLKDSWIAPLRDVDVLCDQNGSSSHFHFSSLRRLELNVMPSFEFARWLLKAGNVEEFVCSSMDFRSFGELPNNTSIKQLVECPEFRSVKKCVLRSHLLCKQTLEMLFKLPNLMQMGDVTMWGCRHEADDFSAVFPDYLSHVIS